MSEILSYELPEHLRARRAAQHRERAVQVTAIVIAITCFFGAGLLIRPINEMRKQHQLVIDPATVKGLPPDIALLGKLGTFRALAIDWASIRADRLKEQGKTYEALSLHLTVCKLQPRFPEAWINASWNMAYNISVCQFTSEGRWQWIRNGITLLRDEGLQFNPKSIGIYKQLAWTYWHKMGDFLDDEHRTYRRALAVEIEGILGAQPVTLTDREYYEWFKKVVDAPRDLKQLIATDPPIADVVERLAAVGFKPDEDLLEFVARHIRPELTRSDLIKAQNEQEDTPDSRTLKILRDPELADSVDLLLSAIRSDVMRNKLKFDLDYMYDMMATQYGPLDWRSPFAHSLYWSSRGNEVSKGRKANSATNSMNTARLVAYSLHGMVVRGKIICTPDFDDPFSSYVEETTDVRYIPYLHDVYLRLAAEQWSDDPDWDPKIGIKGTSFFNGFVSHMHDWIELLYYEGGEENRKLAEEYYTWLRENNPHPDGSFQEMYTAGVDQFVIGNTISQLQTYKQAIAIIRSFIRKSLKELSLGQNRQSLQTMKHAKTSYDYWMADTTRDINERRKIQPIKILRRDVIRMYLTDVQIDALAKARLYKALDLETRQMVYDDIKPYVDQLCDSLDPQWDVSLAFPEPVGMEDFRSQEIEYRGAPRIEGVEQGERYKD